MRLEAGLLIAAAAAPTTPVYGHDHDHSHSHGHSHDHGHGHGHADLPIVDAETVNLFLGGFVPFPMVAMITLLFLKIGFRLAPRFFRHNVRLLALANSFSAGIFLAGGLAHLLPEAAHAFVHVPVSFLACFITVSNSGTCPSTAWAVCCWVSFALGFP